MLAIICAMKSEAEIILERLEYPISTPDGRFTHGVLGETEIIVCVCNPGKVNAAISTAELLAVAGKRPPVDYEVSVVGTPVDLVLNLGVVGGLNEEYKAGDIIVPFSFVQYDIDTTAVGDPPALVSGIGAQFFAASGERTALKAALVARAKPNVRVFSASLCATADRFLGTREEKCEVHERWSAEICDMEAAAIAQTCAVMGVSFVSAKVVSDTLNGGAEEYEKTLSACAVRIADIAEVAAVLYKAGRW